jgi:hypothetical protein
MFVLGDSESTKTCGRCGQRKPASDFAWRRKGRGQRDNYCRICRAEYKREHYATHRDRYIANSLHRKRAIVAERAAHLVAFFRERPCVDCGETDPLVLEFDHLAQKRFVSPRASATAIGSPCSTRSPHATSFVQTVIVDAPPTGRASHARW